MLFLQITFSAEQVSWARDVFNVLIIPFAGWIVKRWIKRLRDALNDFISENLNRVKQELCFYLDTKFKEHEDNAFARISDLEKSVKDLKGVH